ncbi:right-handed parallel beta-helix repeat-containing protein, partial [uncultured Treponema sp.]
YDFLAAVTESITLYAKWTEVITTWTALSEKLNGVLNKDVGDIYISGEFDVTSKITFSGTANIISTGAGATFKRSGSSSDVYDIFYLNPDSMTFKGSETAPIVFDGTYTTERSNLITNMGTTTFEYCSFKNNSSSSYASVYLMEKYTSSNTTFRFCSFTGNKGPKGGAVYVGDGDKVCFENCRFENNTSSSDGGAVYIKASATATFSDCIFGSAEYENLGNSCTGSIGGGGAVYATGASITLSNCEFYYNKATGDSGNGGAIGADSSSTVTITEGCIFKNNETALVDSSSTHGGALYINKSSLVLPNSGNIFENNKEGNKTEHIFSDIYIVSSGTLGTVNGTVYANGSYTVAENGSLTSTSTSQ